MRIFLSPPHMSGQELEYVKDVFRSNYIAPIGKYLGVFENAVSEYTGAKNPLAVVSASAALHLSLHVTGIKAGDVVIASSFTFIGSVGAAHHMGTKLVFIDSEKESWGMDPQLLEQYLSDSKSKNIYPKAVILTHLYGQAAKVEEISVICKRYNVTLIEDAAESLGCTYNGRHTGTFGDIGVYSFNGNKILTTSGGGILVSPNKEYTDKAKFLSTQARENFEYYQHEEVGYNYRMSNVLAAIGAGQMEVIEERISRCRDIFETYKKELESDDIHFMPELKNSRGNRWLTTCTFDNIDYNKIMNALRDKEIESRPLWKPMHMQPVFKNNDRLINGVSEDLFSKGLCLPSGTSLTENEQAEIIDIIKRELKK